MFLRITVTGTVRGSKYGQATVTSDPLRVIVDGQAAKPLRTAAKATAKEGTGVTFDAVWVVPSGPRVFELVVSFGGEVPVSVNLLVGP